jgi:hypothetical protein
MDFTSLSECTLGALGVRSDHPTAIAFRWRSGYFSLAFSACSFVVNGFDSGVNSRPTYLKSSHRSTILGMKVYSTGFTDLRNVTPTSTS